MNTNLSQASDTIQSNKKKPESRDIAVVVEQSWPSITEKSAHEIVIVVQKSFSGLSFFRFHPRVVGHEKAIRELKQVYYKSRTV